MINTTIVLIPEIPKEEIKNDVNGGVSKKKLSRRNRPDKNYKHPF